MGYTAKELSPATFSDFSKVAVKQGGCWCTYYQRSRPVGKGPTTAERIRRNRNDKRAWVIEGRAHAILVYDGATPVGWCQYGKCDELPRIDAGRNYKRVAPQGDRGRLWRITCFFVDRHFRGKGVSKFALAEALKTIACQGGGTVEAYPVVSAGMLAVPEWRWFGTRGMFEKEGFKEVAKLGSSAVLMRKTIAASRRPS
jgi:GNAT superfamily N-acetyltransferase